MPISHIINKENSPTSVALKHCHFSGKKLKHKSEQFMNLSAAWVGIAAQYWKLSIHIISCILFMTSAYAGRWIVPFPSAAPSF